MALSFLIASLLLTSYFILVFFSSSLLVALCFKRNQVESKARDGLLPGKESTAFLPYFQRKQARVCFLWKQSQLWFLWKKAKRMVSKKASLTSRARFLLEKKTEKQQVHCLLEGSLLAWKDSTNKKEGAVCEPMIR